MFELIDQHEPVLLLITGLFSLVSLILILVVLAKSNWADPEEIERTVREEFRLSREEASRSAAELRTEVSIQLKSVTDTLVKTLSRLGAIQEKRLETVDGRIRELTESNERRVEKLRTTLDERLKLLQENNEKKLDQMRQTVDEKLQTTLEKRLTESFRLVSDNLEAVQKGLGEMQNLATGVGDLKRVLTNVKTRGTWGEVQLGALLEQILTPDQYARNVQTREGSREMVEYAVRLPGRDDGPGTCVWLPIDAKFPQEDYLRVLEAGESGNAETLETATEALMRSLKASARDIHDKYLNPPHTTDFAIMFLPTEGLYAEFLRKTGQVETLQRKYRVVVAGPTTLAALLNSLRMGFRTLAIEQRSSEVWKILGAVKTEFGKFGEILSRVKKQLDTASNTIDQTGVRTRAIERNLRSVEQLPADRAADLLRMIDSDDTGEPESGNGQCPQPE
ncbi:DNA recombination protein RmuC [bacterium]|nr:DNA recombination protein RmuC [candidate division CSSED10-310 bacterium]